MDNDKILEETLSQALIDLKSLKMLNMDFSSLPFSQW